MTIRHDCSFTSTTSAPSSLKKRTATAAGNVGPEYVALANTVRRLAAVVAGDADEMNSEMNSDADERELLIDLYVEQSNQIKLSYEETTWELFEEYFDYEQELTELFCRFDTLKLV